MIAVVLANEAAANARVAGLSLVARCVLALARAGAERVDVVGPVDDPELERAGVPVHKVGLAELGEPAVVVRADCVFDVALAKRAFAAKHGERVGGLYNLSAGAVAELRGGVPLTALPARALDPGDALFLSASSEDSRRRAEHQLYQSLRKRVDGPASRWVNRPISLAVTRRVIDTGITPNQMTVVANLVGALGVMLVFRATWLTVALGSLLVQLQSILDGCDGELARLKLQSSRFGEWFDNVLDDTVNMAYGVALGHAASILLGNPLWRWLGIGSALAYVFHNAVMYWQLARVHHSGNPFNFRWWFQRGDQDVTAMLARRGLANRLAAAARSVIRRDVFLLAFCVLAIVRLPQVAVAWYAGVAASQSALMLAHVIMGGTRSR